MAIGGLGGMARGGAPRELLGPFLLSAVAYLVLAALMGLVLVVGYLLGGQPWPGLRPAHVHLALLGSVSQAMLGAIPFFAVALLATAPPDPRLVRIQWWLANFGVLGLAAGFITRSSILAFLGGVSFLGATALVGLILSGMLRRSLLRGRLDVYFYLAAFFFGASGMLLGLLIVTGWVGNTIPHTGLRLAHLHLTLVGWVSMTIVGTMYTFFPTISGTRPGGSGLFTAEFVLLTTGVLLMAIFFSFSGVLWWMPMATLGGIAVTAGAILLGYDVHRAAWGARSRLPLSARHLYAATLHFVVTCLAGLWLALSLLLGRATSGSWLVAYAHFAVIGWIVQTVVGAMLHLLPILAGGRMAAGSAGSTEERYARWARVMGGQAAAQFWLLNGGLLLFVASLMLAPVVPFWSWPALAGGLAVTSGLAVFGRKALLLHTALRRAR